MTTLDLTQLHLDNGSHPSFEAGHCLMEAVAYFAGEPHSDQPKCVSPYLRQFGIRLNDRVTDEQRQDLVRFVPLVVGTAGDGLDDQRRWLAADHVTRVTVPMWLDIAGLTDHSATLRALPAITGRRSWQETRPAIRSARDAAWGLRSERRANIRADVTAAVRKALEERPAAADAVADAAADAVAAAAADAAADRYWAIRRAVYDAVYAKLRAAYGERFATVTAAAWPDALNLYERLINPAAA